MNSSPAPHATTRQDVFSHAGKFLIVDDESSILAIAGAILNTVEVKPLKARTGEEAVAVVRAETDAGGRIGVVIQDLTMPGGMSGFETMEAVRRIDPDIRVIACSGFFQDDAFDLCRSIGFANILAKPYTPDRMLDLIRATLDLENPPLPPKPEPAPPPYESGNDFFAAAAADAERPAPSSPVKISTLSDEDEEDDEDEQLPAPPRVAAHPAETRAPEAEAAQPVGLQAEADESAPPAVKRKPSSLASALARSMRIRLNPLKDRSETSAESPSE